MSVHIGVVQDPQVNDHILLLRDGDALVEGTLQLPPGEGRPITNLDLLMLGIAKAAQTIPFCEAMIALGREVMDAASREEAVAADAG